MDLSEVLALAARLGLVLELSADGERIEYQSERRMTRELRAGIAANKPALLLLLARERGPPAPERAPPARPAMVPPNTTPVPDSFFDELAPTLKEGELRVLLYLIRRTYGFKRGSDQVSLTQFCEGITRQDGRRLDGGTGLARRHVVAALNALEQRGLVRCVRGSAGRGHTSRYALHLSEEDER